ncbi:hypothetical protein EUTSA_v10012204mg [Eutrema salsugineum]|uniref:TTF-type domain-containing protein n=1 Tax=Eutrema salsugineum TaxID=72664 RepID=V4KLI5_EUTSA|nr:hypothetical protein EUTSA_v10012204mg [Eutrema salsugineum]
MKKFLKRKEAHSSSHSDLDDLPDIPLDPADWKKISKYHPNQRNEVTRSYLNRGPCQPRGHIFKQTMIGGVLRRFNPAWFDKYPNWLEYSMKKDAAFCLCCYLFKDDAGKIAKNNVWTTDGFSSWNKLKDISEHVGGVNSFHNNAVMKCENLMKQGQSIKHALHKQDDVTKNEYRTRLNASIDTSRFLLQKWLPFRGHEEKEETANNGNFVELLKYTAKQKEVVSNVVLKNAPGNNQMTSPKIQKDIVHCFAEEVVKTIIEEIDHDVFGLLVDKSADVSYKEQMAVVFRFVDKSGIVKERFISITHVIYRLLKLILILPVATATVERCFSVMKIVKTDGRNRMGDQFLNDCLVCFVEKDVFQTITNESVIKRFQDIKDRKIIL